MTLHFSVQLSEEPTCSDVQPSVVQTLDLAANMANPSWQSKHASCWVAMATLLSNQTNMQTKTFKFWYVSHHYDCKGLKVWLLLEFIAWCFAALWVISDRNVTALKDDVFRTKRSDDDTSDEEREWLKALEAGELDDSGRVKKAKDPKLLTARQVCSNELFTERLIFENNRLLSMNWWEERFCEPRVAGSPGGADMSVWVPTGHRFFFRVVRFPPPSKNHKSAIEKQLQCCMLSRIGSKYTYTYTHTYIWTQSVLFIQAAVY